MLRMSLTRYEEKLGVSDMLRGCYKDASDFNVQPATANKFVRKITALPICPFVMLFSKFHEHDMHDLLQTY